MDGDLIGLFVLLVGLELILGVDNVLVIAILVSRLPESQRPFARNLGLGLAMAMRILMVIGGLKLLALTDPIPFLFDLAKPLSIPEETLAAACSWKGIALMAGGLFLIWKAVKEIHATIELELEKGPKGKAHGFGAIVTQIIILDMVFSLDSVITAVGLTDVKWVIITAVIFSFVIILFFAKPIGDFILAHASIKILALSFLIIIGITIFMEAMKIHVPKALIYGPMGFAMGVQLLQMRYKSNLEKLKKRKSAKAES